MKKGTTIGILLSVICIAALLGLGVFLMIDLKSDSTFSVSLKETEIRRLSQEDAQNVSDGNTDNATAAALAAAQAAGEPLPQHHIIFVGDSRTVGMGEAEGELGDTCTYIGAVGEGYYWLVDSGLSQMEAAMKTEPDAPIILNLGVNDPDMLESYLELYRSFSKRYPDRIFRFMSVNPVTEQSVHITNMDISAFNSALREAFPEQYLDCNTFLMVKEFESVDGVHYSQDTYRDIHDYAVRQLIS